jgi:hypothetical protein
MAACSSCGAALPAADAQCPRCGAKAVPELELQVPVRSSGKPPPKKKMQPEEVSLELAVDPRALVQERSSSSGSGAGTGSGAAPAVQAQGVPSGVLARGAASMAPMAPPQPAPQPAVGDLAFDAGLLGDYGEAPTSLLRTPFYAWRVLRRHRELRAALATRREEAERAENDRLDALVAFAERVRATAEKQPAYAVALEEVRRGEDLLRSRDRVLAADQDAQTARLSAVDVRLSKLEAELAESREQDAVIASELATAQGALSREEAKLKRAEIELRAAQQRESADGTN